MEYFFRLKYAGPNSKHRIEYAGIEGEWVSSGYIGGDSIWLRSTNKVRLIASDTLSKPRIKEHWNEWMHEVNEWLRLNIKKYDIHEVVCYEGMYTVGFVMVDIPSDEESVLFKLRFL